MAKKRVLAPKNTQDPIREPENKPRQDPKENPHPFDRRVYEESFRRFEESGKRPIGDPDKPGYRWW